MSNRATASASLLDQILVATQEAEAARTTRLAAFLAERSTAVALVSWLGLRAGDAVPRREEITARLTIDRAAVDHRLSSQLNAILHAPEFQRLEASWRGIEYLVGQASHAEGVLIRIFDVAWRVLARDLDKAIEFDQSVLFRRVYNDEFGMPGGRPFGVLLGDYYLGHRPRPDQQVDDVRALRAVLQVAAASFAPFIASTHPSLFGVDSFRELGRRIDLHRVFAQSEYIAWNSLRDHEDSRFLALTLPRILMRRPWRPDPQRSDGFPFREDVSGQSGRGYLWGNACFAFGGVLIRAFARCGWFGDIRGVEEGQEGGGLVTDLPNLDFEDQARGGGHRPPTEVVITDAQERTLSDLGFISLCACHGTPWAAFYATPSLQRPQRYDDAAAAANARLSAMLQYILCTARIAHYLKVMCRDRAGSYDSPAQIEHSISKWLFDLSVSSDDADAEAQAKYPLADTSVSVHEVPGKPGTYASVIHLRPHFQLDQMSSSIRLTTEIVATK